MCTAKRLIYLRAQDFDFVFVSVFIQILDIDIVLPTIEEWAHIFSSQISFWIYNLLYCCETHRVLDNLTIPIHTHFKFFFLTVMLLLFVILLFVYCTKYRIIGFMGWWINNKQLHKMILMVKFCVYYDRKSWAFSTKWKSQQWKKNLFILLMFSFCTWISVV